LNKAVRAFPIPVDVDVDVDVFVVVVVVGFSVVLDTAAEELPIAVWVGSQWKLIALRLLLLSLSIPPSLFWFGAMIAVVDFVISGMYGY